MVGLAADQHRRMRPLFRFGIHPYRIEVDVLAVKLGLFLRPQRFHREHALAQQLEARLIAGAVVLHLVDVPAAPDREDESPIGQLIEARHRFGRDDRIALRNQRNARPELEPAGRGGRER
jgi:hypothetical protein